MARFYTTKEKVFAALFYGGMSIVLILAIKTCLTKYKFPDALFLAFAQSCCTIIGLYAGYATRQIELSFSWETFSKVKLLSFVNAMNVGSGLIGTKAVNIPMFAALRRASIPLNMVGEAYILQQQPSSKVQLSVLLMVGGAVVAAMNDLAFDLFGYVAILTSAFCTALSNVLTKSVMTNLPKVGKWNMLLYNNIIAIPVYVLLLCYRGTLPQVYAFADWRNYGFLSTFIASSMLGIILIEYENHRRICRGGDATFEWAKEHAWNGYASAGLVRNRFRSRGSSSYCARLNGACFNHANLSILCKTTYRLLFTYDT